MLFRIPSGASRWALIAVLLSVCPVLAQSTSLRGILADEQGAVIPGVEIVLTSKANQSQRRTVTDDEGRYAFHQVPPGSYSIRAELEGFKTIQVPDLSLEVDNPTTLDLRFQVGEISQTVTVLAAAVELNQSDATVGNNFIERQIVDLPLESRNVVDLLSLQPGVDQQGQVTGARSDQSNLMLDGIDVNEQQTGKAFTPVLRVTPDSVQEFRVTVTNPGASQGRSSGAQVSLVTNAGTDDWHGSAYWFHRNTATTANDFFNNRIGLETPALLRNLFGGSIGGPIKKDRAFFFFNYEGRIDRSQATGVSTVPRPSMGEGSVRYPNIAGGITTLTAEDIARIYPATGGVNPAATALFAAQAAAFPANDSSIGDGLNTSGFRFNASTPLDQNTWIARLDFNLTPRQTLYVRGNYQWDNQQFSSDGQPLIPLFPDGPVEGLWNHPLGGAVGHTWSISPTLVTTTRYGFTRQAFSSIGDNHGNFFSFAGTWRNAKGSRTFSRTTPLHQITNDTTWIKNRHTLNCGINFRFVENTGKSFDTAYDNVFVGSVIYGNEITDPIPDLQAGFSSSFADKMSAVLGRMDFFEANFTFARDGTLLPAGSPTIRSYATSEFDFYFEDSWQLSPRLTANLGLRWGVNRPVHETTGFQVQPVSSLGRFFESRVESARRGIPFNELISIDRSGPFYDRPGYYSTDWNNWQPRISIAWSPDFQHSVLRALFGTAEESVLRGGFALTHDHIGTQLAVTYDLNNTLGFSSRQQVRGLFNLTDHLAPLFGGLDQNIRSLRGIHVPSELRFPLSHDDDGSLRFETSLDDTLTTPVNYSWNLFLGCVPNPVENWRGHKPQVTHYTFPLRRQSSNLQ